MGAGAKQIRSHRDLVVWQKAMELAVTTYDATRKFPKEELYGLTSQMRRASVSIAANIAEGQGRRQKGEFCQFLSNSRGSLLELDTHWELALRLKYIQPAQHAEIQDRIGDVGRLINGLIRSLMPRAATDL